MHSEIIPKGTTLYHGTSVSSKFYSIGGPAWFSKSLKLATIFATGLGGLPGENPRIYCYQTTKDLILASLTLDQAIQLEIGGDGKFHGRFSHAAESFCLDTEIDGWVIKNLFDEFGGEEANISFGELNIDDIMLCNPMDCLKYLEQKPINLQHYIESVWVVKLTPMIRSLAKTRKVKTLIEKQEIARNVIELMDDIVELVAKRTKKI